ncbi:hypothetical protein GEOBRER4_n3073 [Citrifermentans bremense]|uniref:Uncharacterized protein n=1 Tax=Citrifermentans bremense TaxID=60035 RepID=A0A6S6M9S1_9BACT|nr:hypothetical protein [Citrifermentans bremense]BCG48195.1 hypothetical protein GEOBRER4_n3073 [Citrifermentans bremense]
MYRGSRKHVLDWTEKASFLDELADLVSPAPVKFTRHRQYMPRGKALADEARLESFGPSWLPESDVWHKIQNWWLVHKAGANTPNWDIAATCEIEGRAGLVLVEAKANWPELKTVGKPRRRDASVKSQENHDRIGLAIDEACKGWRSLDPRLSMTLDSHYQLANRLAFTWKLATLGLPVVLVYLGFTGDEGIADAGRPFADDADWQKAFTAHVSPIISQSLFEQRLEIEGVPVWLLSRSRKVLEVSPRRPYTKDNPGDRAVRQQGKFKL